MIVINVSAPTLKGFEVGEMCRESLTQHRITIEEGLLVFVVGVWDETGRDFSLGTGVDGIGATFRDKKRGVRVHGVNVNKRFLLTVNEGQSPPYIACSVRK